MRLKRGHFKGSAIPGIRFWSIFDRFWSFLINFDQIWSKYSKLGIRNSPNGVFREGGPKAGPKWGPDHTWFPYNAAVSHVHAHMWKMRASATRAAARAHWTITFHSISCIPLKIRMTLMGPYGVGSMLNIASFDGTYFGLFQVVYAVSKVGI